MNRWRKIALFSRIKVGNVCMKELPFSLWTQAHHWTVNYRLWSAQHHTGIRTRQFQKLQALLTELQARYYGMPLTSTFTSWNGCGRRCWERNYRCKSIYKLLLILLLVLALFLVMWGVNGWNGVQLNKRNPSFNYRVFISEVRKWEWAETSTGTGPRPRSCAACSATTPCRPAPRTSSPRTSRRSTGTVSEHRDILY